MPMDSTLWAAIITGVFTLISALVAAWFASMLSERKQREKPANSSERPNVLEIPQKPRHNVAVQGLPVNIPRIYQRVPFLSFVIIIVGGVIGWAIISGIFYLISPSYDPIDEITSLLLPIILYLIAARFVNPRILLSTKYIVFWLIVAFATIPMSVYLTSLIPSMSGIISCISNALSTFGIFGFIARVIMRFSNKGRNLPASMEFSYSEEQIH